jgi:hypothetical protein
MSDERTREIMDKLYAMTPAEVNQFLGEHFMRLISRPLPVDSLTVDLPKDEKPL